jgi:hypothetical protein
MYTFIRFSGRWAEEDFSIIVPTEIKDLLINTMKKLREEFKSIVVINNIQEENISIYSTVRKPFDNWKDTNRQELKDNINWFTSLKGDDDFEDSEEIKNNLITIGKTCGIDYIEWNYENLM